MDAENATRIAAQTRLGEISLTVRELARSLAFYTESLGLDVLEAGDSQARLGSSGRGLVHLVEQRAAAVPRGRTGLYHLALLEPSRAALARSLRRLAASRTRLSGAADHGVSEALYLNDPDEIGIEIYRDRPREEWPRRGGELAMVTEALDLESLLEEPEEGAAPGGTTLGHVHLHVAQLDAARTFYVDILGFELRQRYGGQALFVAAGGYHHHIGLNTWQGVGAPPPSDPSTGLRHFEIVLPNAEAKARARARLEQAGVAVRSDAGERLTLQDPSGNGIVLV